MSACVRDIMSERSAQLLAAVCEELGVVGTTRNRDIRHAVVKQVFCSKFCVHVDKHPVGGLSLAGVTGHGVAVVEMWMLHRIKLNLAASVHLDGHTPFRDALYGAQFTIRQLHLRHRSGELHSVAGRERPLLFTVDGDALLTAWIVGLLSAVFHLDSEPIIRRIYLCHSRILALGDASLVRCATVAQDIALV